MARVIELEKPALPGDADLVALVNAAARSRRCILDAELSPK
jgi:hypothetical protein